jgi:hypothetical protein
MGFVQVSSLQFLPPGSPGRPNSLRSRAKNATPGLRVNVPGRAGQAFKMAQNAADFKGRGCTEGEITAIALAEGLAMDSRYVRLSVAAATA